MSLPPFNLNDYMLAVAIMLLLLSFIVLYCAIGRQRKASEQIANRYADLHALLLALQESRLKDQQLFSELKAQLWQELQDYRHALDQQQLQGFALLQTSLQQSMKGVGERMDQLTGVVQERLQTIGGYMEQRLSDGFAKTTETFTQVMERLGLIDAAQKQISELSSHVISLQHVLADKRARGVFGEIQLYDLIRNVLPPSCFKVQYTFSNGKRADCVLFLPPPTGTIAIDAKFPLESFQRIMATDLNEIARRAAHTQFRQDVRYHIQAVAKKYIIPGETAEGAILFIPAETIFAEIHANHIVIVEEAQRLGVWLTSPSTLMAVLTTARAVLKDARTREQIHLIQKHLICLREDFVRFQQRMNKLAQHIQQAHTDIQEAQTSAKKISHRFEKIENVELSIPTRDSVDSA